MYSPYGPSWPVLWWTLPLPLLYLYEDRRTMESWASILSLSELSDPRVGRILLQRNSLVPILLAIEYNLAVVNADRKNR